MFACVGLLAIHRFQVVAIVVLVASGTVLAVWGAGFVRKFGRSGPLNDEERQAAEAELRAKRGTPVSDFGPSRSGR
jgi:hypothetical protein